MLKGNGVKILSTGSFLPKKIIKNDELDKSLETNDEWIVQRTGIKQRHISSESEDSAEMATFAALDAISKFKKINPDFSPQNEIGLIIVATVTPNKIFPSVSAQVSAKLGLKKDVIVFDLNAVCSGFLYAFVVANNLISCSPGGNLKKALVIGSEQMSSIVDWTDRSTCVLFGDGAGALLLGHEQERSINDVFAHVSDESAGRPGMIDYLLRSDGALGEILYAQNKLECLKMNGKEVFLTACKDLEKTIRDFCERN
jgi:3-oxoacyl-[acyl-carrier-protein] synthase-3